MPVFDLSISACGGESVYYHNVDNQECVASAERVLLLMEYRGYLVRE